MFLSKFIDDKTGLPHASYDLWEQKFLTSNYTACIVIAALDTASELATVCNHPDDASSWRHAADKIRSNLGPLYHPAGYFRKGFLLQDNGDLAFDDTLDISSLYGVYMYAQLPLDDERMRETFTQVKNRLFNTSPLGGVIRYPGDDYFLEKKLYKGNPWIVCSLWLAQYFNAVGEKEEAQKLLQWARERALPSGVLSEQFDPETGSTLGVVPLVWSHAEFINTSLDLARIK
jgi:GH15 family glucan-1,4-alpha-glucosidase